MSDYISRDSLIKQLGELPCKKLIPVTTICSLIKHFPAADVEERKHGKWRVYETANTEEEQPIAWECSECEEVVDCKYNFCPECGARMDGAE